MTCYRPLQGRFSTVPNPSGKFKVLFSDKAIHREIDHVGDSVQVPCGQCMGCRLDYSAKWAIRCVHEAMMHEDNCFITLTYDTVPYGGTLVKSDFQNFAKRLRKRLYPRKVRYYMCGEYGERLGRPHYHAILFGVNFADNYLSFGGLENVVELVDRREDIRLYKSSLLDVLWPHGYSSVGAVTFDSAAYVARYATKKITGQKAEDHYTRIDEDTGEVHFLQREYSQPSTRPGVAKAWFDKYGVHSYVGDFCVTPSGARMQPPRYYDSLYEHVDPSKLLQIKEDRKFKAMLSLGATTPERLRVREIIKRVQFEMLPRLLK